MQKRKIIFSANCLLIALMFLSGCNGGGDSAAVPANATSAEKAGAALNAVNPAAQANQALGLIDDSQRKAANNAIAEVQARVTNVYTGNMLKSVSPNDCAAVLSAVNAEIGTLGDFSVKLTSTCPAGFTIAVVAIKGRPLGDPLTGAWSFPGN
jgi:hypothetical protein